MRLTMDEYAEQLAGDLAGFATHRTEVGVEVLGRSLRATWIQRGGERTELFSIDADDRLVWQMDAGNATYRDFLRSDSMAAFDDLAASICRKYEALEHYVPANALIADQVGSVDEIEASLPSIIGLVGARLQGASDSTTILFVKGDAGAGKTTLLEQLATQQARGHLHGDDPGGYLFLQVSAQGRLLSNLSDALAAETQDLDASFRNDAVSVLARRGVLIPIIDGFDELIGTAGYSDAFSSLQGLLREMSGNGLLIVSARSSFYEAEFVNSGQYFDESAYSVSPLTLLPWSDAQLVTYLEKALPAEEAHAAIALLDDVGPADRRLLTRPFFGSPRGLGVSHRPGRSIWMPAQQR